MFTRNPATVEYFKLVFAYMLMGYYCTRQREVIASNWEWELEKQTKNIWIMWIINVNNFLKYPKYSYIYVAHELECRKMTLKHAMHLPKYYKRGIFSCGFTNLRINRRHSRSHCHLPPSCLYPSSVNMSYSAIVDSVHYIIIM